MKTETMRVKLREGGTEMVINACDYDSAIHEKINEGATDSAPAPVGTDPVGTDPVEKSHEKTDGEGEKQAPSEVIDPPADSVPSTPLSEASESTDAASAGEVMSVKPEEQANPEPPKATRGRR